VLYDRIKNRKENKKNPKDNQHLIQMLQKIRKKLVDFEQSEWEGQSIDEVRNKIEDLIKDFLVEQGEFLPKEEKDLLIEQVIQDITGLGPIQSLLEDDSISEIMINGPKQLYIERKGKIELTSHTFINDDHVMNVIDRIISPLGRRIDESCPMVDARLSDGSRVNAIIPPLALNGPTVTIRKFKKGSFSIEDLIQFGTLSQEMANFLEKAVRNRMNILVAGGTGSGKTTLLNILSSFIPKNERIVTIEDAAELKLHQPHIISLESRPPNIEGKGQIAIRDLLRNSLRMRPDRIIVGEVRGGESLDMLQAMNTGHDGSLSTIHANNPRDVISRLETLMLMAGYDIPLKAIREQIASAIDLIIEQKRFSDGTRKITHITQIDGIESGTIVLQDLFVFEEMRTYRSKEVKGRFKQAGILPTFMERGD